MSEASEHKCPYNAMSPNDDECGQDNGWLCDRCKEDLADVRVEKILVALDGLEDRLSEINAAARAR